MGSGRERKGECRSKKKNRGYGGKKGKRKEERKNGKRRLNTRAKSSKKRIETLTKNKRTNEHILTSIPVSIASNCSRNSDEPSLLFIAVS
jgi:hypothetical protein